MNKFTLKSYFRFTRFTVSLSVTFSALTAYVIYIHKIDWQVLLPVTGVFLLSCGASALNQYQERKFDSKMARTQCRPLPANEISCSTALIISLLIISFGLILLWIHAVRISLLLGIFSILWYNFFYTILKRKTAFAIVPGSLTGTIPVFIGWTAAGGYIFDPIVIFLAFFIFIWQIPHFWLLLMRYGKEYNLAGLPSITNVFKTRQLKNMIFTWIIASCIFPLLFRLFAIVEGTSSTIALITLILVFLSYFTLIFTGKTEIHFKKAFIGINLFLIAVLVILLIDHL